MITAEQSNTRPIVKVPQPIRSVRSLGASIPESQFRWDACTFPDWLVLSIALCPAVGGLPGLVKVGSISLGGYETIVVALLTIIGISVNPVFPRRLFRNCGVLLAFFAWAVVSAIWNPPRMWQNYAALLSFYGLVILTASRTSQCPVLGLKLMKTLLSAIIVYAAICFPATLLYGGTFVTGKRGSAIIACMGISIALAGWRYRERLHLVTVLFLVGSIIASLSRMATLMALLLFPMSSVGIAHKKMMTGRVLLGVAFSIGVFAYLVANVPAIQERFFFGGDIYDYINGTASLDTAGRQEMWTAVLSSWESSVSTIWLGQGSGSSDPAVSTAISDMHHPHNDYLRVLHDYGAIGALMLVAGLMLVLSSTLSEWRLADKTYPRFAPLHAAAFLGAVTLAVMMITDNPIAYTFVLIPVGLLLGASIGVEDARCRGRVYLST